MQVETIPENYELRETIPRGVFSVNEFPTKLVQSITNIIEKEEYVTYKIHTQPISTNGGNYLGELYAVDIEGTTKDGDKTSNLFVKIIKGGESTILMSMNDLYQTELFAYKELSKIFSELQEDANVPLNERYKMVKCYEDSTSEVIIFENITRKEYTTPHRMDVVTLKFAERSIKELAKFHALSFVLQDKRPEYFNSKIKTINHHFLFSDAWHGFVKSMFHVVMKYVDDDVKAKVEDTYYTAANSFTEYLEDESLHICLCHGDYRPNNIMRKIKDGEVTDVIPVDYQLMFYGCPVLDFLYFIFNSTDREFRKAHLSHLKDLYHDTMREFMKYFDMDIELVYPRKKFDDIYKQKLNYGLLVGYLFLPFMLVSEDDIPDITKELSEISFQIDDIYKDRLRGIIDDFIEWGYV